MDNEKYKLERKSIIVDIKLEKEKSKRNIIMILIYSVICGLVCTAINDNFETFIDIIALIGVSVFLGGFFYFVTITAFVFITDNFTDVSYLESRKRHIKDELKYNFQDKNTLSNFNIDKIKKHAKSKLTDKDYETILKCIEFSINLHKFEIESDDELTTEEKSIELEKLNGYNRTLDVFTTRSKPSSFEKTTALNCVYTYFDTMIDISDFNKNISNERKNELYQKITELNSVIFKLELQ